jgi:hypothetical protein
MFELQTGQGSRANNLCASILSKVTLTQKKGRDSLIMWGVWRVYSTLYYCWITVF